MALPEPPLLAAGALGGPLVIVSLTPLRNAMSNCAQDRSSSFASLYRPPHPSRAATPPPPHRSQDRSSSFASLYRQLLGPPTLRLSAQLRRAYTGALVSAAPACPQWCIIGPAFHALHLALPTPLALLGAAALETSITFGSQTRNAQLAFNLLAPRRAVELSAVLRPWGPGAPFYLMRNWCGMAGIRWLSPPVEAALRPVLPAGPREVAADMAASMATCVVSAPLNSCWSYVATTPATWGMGFPQLLREVAPFLRRQYLDPSGRGLSRIALRDLSVRCVYIASSFTMFRGIERLAVAYWPRS